MRRRCKDPKNNRFKNYGGKGIKVCEEWKTSFKSFCFDMGNRPTERHSLDRIDNNKGYHKENCRWATPQEQARNKSTSIYIFYNGKKITLFELSIILKMPYKLLFYRYKKWGDGERLLSKKRKLRRFYLNGKQATALELSCVLNVSIATIFRWINLKKIPLKGFHADS